MWKVLYSNIFVTMTLYLACLLSLSLILAAAHDEPVKTRCEPSETVTFVKLDRHISGLINDNHMTFTDKTLLQCSIMCSENMHSSLCAGFAYSSQKQTCILTESGPDLLISDKLNKVDNLILSPTKAGDFRGEREETGLYQKVCLRATVADYLPTNIPYSFQLLKNRVLTGSTEEVVSADSLAQCLSVCLEASDIFDISCKSVMYYYETGQCLLNSMDRAGSNIDNLSNDTDSMHVDYFENLVVGHECGPGTVPQYVYLSNKDMIEEHGFVIDKVSKFTCQHYCTSNKGANGQLSMCKSYAYQESKQLCYLMNEQVLPRGQGLAKETTGVEIYEKVCLTAAQTCVKTPAFERVPMHLLIGFAQIVMENVKNEQLCLSECLASFETMAFDCMSVMYYYETNECILNFDSRLSQTAKPFFTNLTEGYKVDYFDNLCALRLRDAGQALNKCPDNLASSFVQFNETELPQYFVESLTTADLDECLSKCDKVKNFTCNSVDYRTTDSICTLSHVDSRTSSLMITPYSYHFERHCLEGTISCQDKPVSFITESGLRISRFATLTVEGISLDECLSLCLLDPTISCKSVNYDRRNTSCELNNVTKSDSNTVEDADVDYYENKCFDANPYRKAIIKQSLVGEVLAAQTGIDIHTNCLYSSMKVIMTAQQPFNGYMFAKNKFWTCGVQVQNSANGQLVLSFPTFSGAQNDCGVVALSPSKYSVILAVTMNNLGIPGLVADGDRFFNITCDYTSAFQNRVTAVAPNIAVSNAVGEAQLFPDGVINIPSPVQFQMRKFADDHQGGTVHMVEVGEQVTLDIIYAEGFNRSLLDFFARQCNASRHYGPPPNPEPLVLIKDGCPTPSVVNKIVRSPVERTANGLSLSFTAFRFDGSNSVKITCLVDLCERHCNPTSCNINGQAVPSYGRKKRFDLKHKIKKSETSSFIFTVVDRLPVENQEIPISNKLERLKKLQNNVGDYSDHYLDGSQRKQFCLKKSTFFGVFMFLSILCVCQVVVIIVYIVRRFLKTTVKKFF